MTREVHANDRLTPMESLMWRLEGDRALSATFGSVTFLDREPDPERFRSRMAGAAASIRRLRQRIDAGGPLAPSSIWIDDPDFELANHLRWEPCPGDGTDQAVLDMAADLVAAPFDPDRPLWAFVVVTGLDGGRAALVQRMHHTITDGKGGLRISERFVDLERGDPGPTPDPFVGADPPAPRPSWFDRTVLATVDQATDVAHAGMQAARWTVEGLRDPQRFNTLGSEVRSTARSLGRQLAVTDRARSVLWADRSNDRRFVAGSLPFDPVRTAATEAGVSINDVFVTAALRGAAAYHRVIDHPVHELRVAIPVSTRDDALAGGNAFSPTRVVLPSGEQLAAPAHLRAVSDALGATKHERATGLIEPVAAATELMPSPLLRAAVRWQAATIDFTTSNLRAAPVPLYIAGARIEATYAIGPLAATAANITMMSYDGRIDLGVHVDTAAVTEPELLRDTVVAAFHELCEAASSLG
ncbi:MAG: wax ester/triacylglycerol synthase domain-containing protein [Acidimicrobiales bacterium]